MRQVYSGGPYFQFGLSNNYGANFYTWEFEKIHKHFFEIGHLGANKEVVGKGFISNNVTKGKSAGIILKIA